ncbi:hypothetical protein [Pollutibacter soli]|uniref:hypothetical protein n=1 Tax=Pollutibacter soli TaxID=3034157 RepID=UPI003013E0D0
MIETEPGMVSDTGRVVIIVDAEAGNKGLSDFNGPVFVHTGLITDSSEYPNEWRYVKFKWGSMEERAGAIEIGKNKWAYTIPDIRSFFGVSKDEKILKLAFLFRERNCIDTFCSVLWNVDKSDLSIDIAGRQML